jgi:hypothetical protein
MTQSAVVIRHYAGVRVRTFSMTKKCRPTLLVRAAVLDEVIIPPELFGYNECVQRKRMLHKRANGGQYGI